MTTTINANCLALEPLLLGATPEQLHRILPPFCGSYHLASFCLTEPSGGTDARGMKTRARQDGDHYVLDGEKCFITNGPHADLYTVFATVDPSRSTGGSPPSRSRRGPTGSSRGRTRTRWGTGPRRRPRSGSRASASRSKDRIGAEGEGFSLAMRTLDQTRTPIGALATGIAQAALDYASDYSLKRQSFGKPIGEHQAIQMKLAEMAQQVHASRLLIWRAAWTIDQGGERDARVGDREELRLRCGAARRRRGDPDVRLATAT